MTAVYNAIRNLDALLDRGELSPEEYARRRKTLLENIEDAQSDIIDITPDTPAEPDQPTPVQGGTSALILGLVVVLSVMGLCIALTLLFLPSMNLALTLGVTIIAAISVGLLRASDD